MRVKHKPWAKDYIDDMDNIFINSYIDKDNLSQLIGEFSNVYMEIGCGKGSFIYEHAKNNPDNLYIGVERQASVIVTAAKKQELKPLKNLKFYYGDIFNLNENDILKDKLLCIYLNFSDPWPKKRHIKRRLTNDKFLNLYYELLKNDGFLEQKTDNDSLFEYSLVSLANHGKWTFDEVILDLHSKENIENIQTEYEERFSSLGFKIKFLRVFRK